MNSKKIYSVFYYIALLLSIFVYAMPNILPSNVSFYIQLSELSQIIALVNVILVVFFTILLIRGNIDKVNIMFPIIHIVFTIIVLVICALFNNRLVVPYVHYSYYIQFILVNYTLLNIYSVLSFNKSSI